MSFGQMYLDLEKKIFWVAYAIIPVVATLLSLAALGVSKTRELQAFFLYIALLTMFAPILILL